MYSDYFKYRILPLINIISWIYWGCTLLYVIFQKTVNDIQPTNWHLLVLILLPIMEILIDPEE